MRTRFFSRPIIILLLIIVTVIWVGTAGFTVLEGLDPFQAFYFTIVTIATVGYGDIYPVTTAGRLLAIILILTGVGTFTAFLFNLARFLQEGRLQQTRNEQTSILMGIYFNAVGDSLLAHFSSADPNSRDIGKNIITSNQTENDFILLSERFQQHKYEIDRKQIQLDYLKELLTKNRDILTRMIESPTLVEQDQPTELLRATFHLLEELTARRSLDDLPDSDVRHLAFDSVRVYKLAAAQWLDHIHYVKLKYPYLFNLVLRTNPFNEDRSAIVKE